MLNALTGVRLRNRPGTGHGRYSNLGAGLLGIALRRAAGAADFQSLVSDAVLGPLDMTDTVVTPAATRPRVGSRATARVAVRSTAGTSRAWPERARCARPRTTCCVTCAPSWSPNVRPWPPPSRRTRVLTEPQRRYTIGLGWIRTRIPAGDLWWHNGGTGGFRSFAGFCPQRQRGAVVLVNDRRGPDRAGIELIGGVRRRS